MESLYQLKLFSTNDKHSNKTMAIMEKTCNRYSYLSTNGYINNSETTTTVTSNLKGLSNTNNGSTTQTFCKRVHFDDSISLEYTYSADAYDRTPIDDNGFWNDGWAYDSGEEDLDDYDDFLEELDTLDYATSSASHDRHRGRGDRHFYSTANSPAHKKIRFNSDKRNDLSVLDEIDFQIIYNSPRLYLTLRHDVQNQNISSYHKWDEEDNISSDSVPSYTSGSFSSSSSSAYDDDDQDSTIDFDEFEFGYDDDEF